MKKIILLLALAITTISCTKDDNAYAEPLDYGASNNYGSSRGVPVESFDFTTSTYWRSFICKTSGGNYPILKANFRFKYDHTTQVLVMDDLDNGIEFDKEEKINCVESISGDDLTFVEVRTDGFSLMSYRITFRNYIAAGVYEKIKGGLNYIHYVNDCEEILKYRK